MPVIIQLNSLLFLLLHSFVSFLLSFLFLFLFPNTTSFFTYVVFAACAVVATALAQIFTNTYQKSLDCNAMQLLYHTSPIIALVRKEHSRNNVPRTSLSFLYSYAHSGKKLLLCSHFKRISIYSVLFFLFSFFLHHFDVFVMYFECYLFVSSFVELN